MTSLADAFAQATTEEARPERKRPKRSRRARTVREPEPAPKPKSLMQQAREKAEHIKISGRFTCKRCGGCHALGLPSWLIITSQQAIQECCGLCVRKTDSKAYAVGNFTTK